MSCGTRAQHFRPGDPDGAQLLRSLPLGKLLPYSWWPLTAPLRQPAPSPVLHLLWLRTPLPNFPVRAPQPDAIYRGPTGTADCTYILRSCSRQPLRTAGHPVRGQSRRHPATTLASQLHHRTAIHPATADNYCLAVHLCHALLSLLDTRETITTLHPNVYLSRHRFPDVGQEDCLPDTRTERERTTTPARTLAPDQNRYPQPPSPATLPTG